MLQVAVKVIRKSQVQSESTKFSRIQKEVDILRTMKHPNIVKLIDVLEANDHIGIVLEYASGGELFNYILRQRYLKEPEACRLFCQLVSGVSYLHDHGVVHRDLKLVWEKLSECKRHCVDFYSLRLISVYLRIYFLIRIGFRKTCC